MKYAVKVGNELLVKTQKINGEHHMWVTNNADEAAVFSTRFQAAVQRIVLKVRGVDGEVVALS